MAASYHRTVSFFAEADPEPLPLDLSSDVCSGTRDGPVPNELGLGDSTGSSSGGAGGTPAVPLGLVRTGGNSLHAGGEDDGGPAYADTGAAEATIVPLQQGLQDTQSTVSRLQGEPPLGPDGSMLAPALAGTALPLRRSPLHRSSPGSLPQPTGVERSSSMPGLAAAGNSHLARRNSSGSLAVGGPAGAAAGGPLDRSALEELRDELLGRPAGTRPPGAAGAAAAARPGLGGMATARSADMPGGGPLPFVPPVSRAHSALFSGKWGRRPGGGGAAGQRTGCPNC